MLIFYSYLALQRKKHLISGLLAVLQHLLLADVLLLHQTELDLHSVEEGSSHHLMG
jgi:hypothetical protein